ncbi:MAG TPA: DUF4062 domain-containing protein [Thermoanaerobaculia bacterium]|nr:DUF4062 domain-containing protein [Thermoanaerobaculia bacterium]
MSIEDLLSRLQREQPVLLRLAEAVSLAVRVDPPLLRRARRELVPEADAGTEADLWRSPLVQSRGPEGFVFLPEAAEALRARLARYEGGRSLAKAWELTKTLHRHLSPALLLEEKIAYLSVAELGTTGQIEAELHTALAALMAGRQGLANWAARAFVALPSKARDLDAARMLRAGAHLRLGQGVLPSGDEKEVLTAPWLVPTDLPRVPVAVRLFEEIVELDARTNAEGQQIQIPQTDRLLVELSWGEPGREEVRRATFRKGEVQRIPVPVQNVRLRTILGEVYDLRKAGTVPRGLRDWIIDFSEERARHRPFFGREEESERIRKLITIPGNPSSVGGGMLILVTGEVGTGKTALLSNFLEATSGEALKYPHHFFRRGNSRLEDLAVAERSLIAQIVSLYPEIALMASHLRLREILQMMLDQGLVIQERGRLVVVLDAVDEARSSDGSHGGELLELLPEQLPVQVVVIASATSAKGLRLPGPVVEVQLSDPKPAMQEFWRQHFRQSEQSVEEFTRLSAGSFGIAKILRSWLEQTDGRGLFPAAGEALETIWEELVTMVGRKVRDLWLGFLATAYGPLPALLLYRLTWGGQARQHLDPLLSSQGEQHDQTYELKEEVLRSFISSSLDFDQFPRKVFLSSTVMDLKPYRDAVYSAIQNLDGYLCWRFEEFYGSPRELAEEARRRIEDCDVFVSLVGHRRGTTPIDNVLSYTELEYEEAKKQGKPILFFMAADDVPLPQNLVEADDVRQEQIAFRERAKSEMVIGHFRDTQGLARQVVNALYDVNKKESIAALHRRLAEVTSEAIFADDSSESARSYGLRYALAHWLAAQDVEKAFELVTRIDFYKPAARNSASLRRAETSGFGLKNQFFPSHS